MGGGFHALIARPSLSNTIIAGNTAAIVGGSYLGSNAEASLSHCIIAENSARFGPGGAAYIYNSSPRLPLCTITANVADSTGGGLHFSSKTCWPALVNCTLWGDTPYEISGEETPPENITLTYCNVEGGYDGEGNWDAPPRFRFMGRFDYLLGPNSPCIDRGTGEDDGVDGARIDPRYGRINSSAPDIGAYGAPGAAGWFP